MRPNGEPVPMSKNVFTSCRRSLCLILCLLFCGMSLAGRADAALDVINQYYHVEPSLESGNANKVVVGKLNHLHAVFANPDSTTGITDIIYEHFNPLAQMQNQPSVWDEYQLTSDGTSSLPALAVDSDGRAVVVWVSKPSAQSVLGGIYYRYQTTLHCESCWSAPHQIVAAGTEPSIAVENGEVYLAWTTRDRVQFTSFQKWTPPSVPLWLGNVVDFTNCPNTKFHQPSIAYVHPPCGITNLKIAALAAANEQSTAGSCHNPQTEVGPHVYERDNTTTNWSEVTFLTPEVATSTVQNQPDPAAVSISLNGSRLTGEFYLAWSDQLNGVKRTRLGHGSGAAWDFTALDPLAHHVHVAAKGNAYGKFRLAVSGQGWSPGAFTLTGKWSAGQLTWTSGPLQIADATYPYVAHPQALYWSRCASNRLKEIKTYTEADDYLSDTLNEVATDLTETGPVSCWQISTDVLPFPNCYQSHISIGQLAPGSGDAVLIDLGDTAAVTRLSPTGAEIAAFGGGTIHVTWAPGELLSSWENGFTVATSRSSVRISGSDDAHYTIEDLGLLSTPGKK